MKKTLKFIYKWLVTIGILYALMYSAKGIMYLIRMQNPYVLTAMFISVCALVIVLLAEMED